MNYYETLKCGKPVEKEIEELVEDIRSFKGSLKKGKMNEITKAFVKRMLANARKDLNNIRFHLERPTEKDISEADIVRARDYPITQLIEFNGAGMAKAFCHEDKQPSLSYWAKANNCRCFVCGKSFDSIAVLVERDGMSFIEAVKKLR